MRSTTISWLTTIVAQTPTHASPLNSEGLVLSLAVVNVQRWQHVQRVWLSCAFMASRRHSPTTPLANRGTKILSINSSSNWYPLLLTKISESSEHIFVQKRRTLAVDLSQTKPYFEVTISNSYLVTKNGFQRYIICLYLKALAKSHVFRDNLWKMPI